MVEKIQTGLRVSEKTYDALKKQSQENGLSINALILFYLDAGMRAVNLGIEEVRREQLRIPRDSA